MYVKHIISNCKTFWNRIQVVLVPSWEGWPPRSWQLTVPWLWFN
jgi:hypothetical protein